MLSKAHQNLVRKQRRYLDANETMHFVALARQQGRRTRAAVDIFSETNAKKAQALEIHIDAIKKAIGRTLTKEALRTGEVAEDESAIVFTNLLNALPHHIKNYRVSRNIRIISDEETAKKQLYLGEKPINFSSTLLPYQADIIAKLETTINEMDADASHESRIITPADFGALLLSGESLQASLGEEFIAITVVKPHAKIAKNALAKSLWENDIFAGHGTTIRDFLLDQPWSFTRENFIETLEEKAEGLQIDDVLTLLVEQGLIEYSDEYQLSNNIKTIIQNYLKTKLKLHKPALDANTIQSLKLPHLVEQLTTYAESDDATTYCELTLDDMEYFDVVKQLYAAGLVEHQLTTELSLQTALTASQQPLFEEALILAAESDFFTLQSIGIPNTATEAGTRIWSELAAAGVVRDPAVHFPFLSKSKSKINHELDKISAAVKANMATIVQDIPAFAASTDSTCSSSGSTDATSYSSYSYSDSDDDTLSPSSRAKHMQDLAAAINKVLKDTIGTLRTIGDIELRNRSLLDYFDDENLPPVILDFVRQACGEVLNLIEHVKRKRSWFGSLIVALIGVAQVVAGVMITVFCPPAALLGEMLISEGVSDISFAVQSYIAGTFSWSAYREHKLQSLAMSLLTTGVSAALSSTATTAKTAATTAKTSSSLIAKAVLQKLASTAIDVAVSIGVNAVISGLSKEIVNGIFKKFQQDFKQIVRRNAAKHITAIKEALTTLNAHVGIHDTQRIFQNALQTINLSRILSQDISRHALMAMEAITSKLSSLKKRGTSGNLFDAALNASSILVQILHIADYLSAIRGITKTSVAIFAQLREQLESKVARFTKNQTRHAADADTVAIESERMVDTTTDMILNQIEQQVSQIFKRIGIQGANLALSPLVHAAHSAVHDALDAVFAEPVVCRCRRRHASILRVCSNNDYR